MNSQKKPTGNKRYIIETSLMAIVGLPLLMQLAVFGAISLSLSELLASVLASLITLPIGYLWAKKKNLPPSFFARYLPVLIPLIYCLLLWSLAMFIGKGDFTHSAFEYFMLLIFPFLGTSLIAIFTGQLWITILMPLIGYLCFALGIVIGTKKLGKNMNVTRGRLPVLGLCSALLILTACQGYQRETKLVTENYKLTVNETLDLWNYKPFESENRLTALATPATLSFSSDWPKIDGATAAYPIYASAVQALYQGLDRSSVKPYIASTRTPEAYKSLIGGDIDLIFAAQPSEQQKQLAADNGLTLTMVPFAREAFVFIAHKDNPITNLSVEQIRSIYAGKINNWQEVGGPDRRIIPFQRPEGSGSQTTMLAKVMQNTAIRQPLESEMAQGMGGIIRQVANYQNTPDSLGYSFRYYASKMNQNENLQLLSVNGIAPTVENIRNGSYPFSVSVYMVTARQPTPNTQKLMDWFLSPQGQKLVEDVGYVPVGSTE